MLYIHEIAMHKDHNIDDFKPPYNIDVSAKEEEQADHATPAHTTHLHACVDATHAIFEAFLALDINTVRALPTILFVRTSYAAVGMIKMYISFSNPKSKLSKVFNANDLKVEYYLERVSQGLQAAGEGGRCRSAAKFGQIMSMLRTWLQKKQEEDQKGGSKGPSWDGMLKADGLFKMPRMEVRAFALLLLTLGLTRISRRKRNKNNNLSRKVVWKCSARLRWTTPTVNSSRLPTTGSIRPIRTRWPTA